MSDHEKVERKHAEAGYQWLVEDNTPPETAAEKKEQARQRKRLTAAAENKGGWELGLTEQAAEMLPNLELTPALVHHGGADLYGYQTNANMFNGTMRLAMNGLGRAKDLAEAGAPLEPSAVSPKLKRRLEKKAHGAGAEQAFEQWRQTSNELEKSLDDSTDAKALMQGAIENLLQARMYLDKRRNRAARAEAATKVQQIDDAVADLQLLIDVSMDVGKIVLSGGLDALKIGEGLAKYAGGKAVEQIDFKTVLRMALHKQGEYEAYLQKVKDLDAKLVQLDFDQENAIIRSATSTLIGWQMSVRSQDRHLLGAKTLSRAGAQGFARSLGGQSEVVLMTQMSEAYNELDMFGRRAAERIEPVAKLAQKVDNWIDRMYAHADIGMRAGDANDKALQRLDAHVAKVPDAHTFLTTSTPEWSRVAAAWRGFIRDLTGKSMDPAEDSAEAEIARP